MRFPKNANHILNDRRDAHPRSQQITVKASDSFTDMEGAQRFGRERAGVRHTRRIT